VGVLYRLFFGAILAPFCSILLLAVFFFVLSGQSVVFNYSRHAPCHGGAHCRPGFYHVACHWTDACIGLIALAAAILIWLLGVSPIWVILAAGLGGYLWHMLDKRRKGEMKK
jgi:chromate transporter